jgi:hypothetical protein
VYGEFVAEFPVTVTEHEELVPDAAARVQLGVGLNVTPAAELNVTVPVGAVFWLPGVIASVTVTVKICEFPMRTLAVAGLHTVVVGCLAVRLKF